MSKTDYEKLNKSLENLKERESIPEKFQKNIKEKYVVLQESSSPKGWREYGLLDVIDLIIGGTPKTTVAGYWNGVIPWVSIEDFNTNKKTIFVSKKKITEKGLQNSSTNLLNEGNIIISARGTVGVIAMIGTKMAFSQSCYGIRIKKTLAVNDYIFYLLKNTVKHFIQRSHGGIFDTITKNTFKEIKINLPPLSEQKAIAEVLSSLDDKIDLLHRQNKTLEDMAQALFRKWFVANSEKIFWPITHLGKVTEIFDSRRVPVPKMQRDKMKTGTLYPYYGAAQIVDYVNDYIFDGEYILIGEDGTVKTEEGFPLLQYATGKFWVNNHTHVLQAKPPYNNYFIWHFLLKLSVENIITGAVQPKINQSNLNAIKIPEPPLNMVKEFQSKMASNFEKSQNNQSQIRILEKLRDTLLPKLIIGKIRVKF